MRGRISIERYCGKERLPGGERRWRRLARAVGFTGRVSVFGYGVHGTPAVGHRKAARSGTDKIVNGDFSPGVIRIWLDCSCGLSLDDMADETGVFDTTALRTFAHELGHFALDKRGRNYHNEAAAERYGRLLLRSVA